MMVVADGGGWGAAEAFVLFVSGTASSPALPGGPAHVSVPQLFVV